MPKRTSSRHPKPPTRGVSCLSLVLYGIRIDSEGLVFIFFNLGDVCTISLHCVLSVSGCPLCKVMKKSVFQSVSQSITLVGRGVNTGNIVINEYMNTKTNQDPLTG